MAAYSAEDFRTLQKFVANYYAAIGKDIQAELDYVESLYGADAPNDNVRMEEVVAKTVEALASDREALETAVADAQPEQDVLRREELRQLRQEILYLSALRRKIMISFYYDEKKGDEIARELSIPASTVRWHLKQAKETIKERMNMAENTLYQPVHLWIGHNGNVKSPVYDDLRHDNLTQNICWVCREKALTVEEIARTLGVAAVYLEYKLEKLLEMEYKKLRTRGCTASN